MENYSQKFLLESFTKNRQEIKNTTNKVFAKKGQMEAIELLNNYCTFVQSLSRKT